MQNMFSDPNFMSEKLPLSSHKRTGSGLVTIFDTFFCKQNSQRVGEYF